MDGLNYNQSLKRSSGGGGGEGSKSTTTVGKTNVPASMADPYKAYQEQKFYEYMAPKPFSAAQKTPKPIF
jgi:hypothetical protein